MLLLTLILSLFVDLYLQTPAQAQSSTPNVIAIGDSLTDDFGNGGWRAPLKTKLAAAGQSINYVGSRSDGAGNHEAYGGASSCDFFTDRGTFMATTYGKAPTWDIRTALTAAAPNIAIIYIGTTNYIEDYQLTQGLATTAPCGLNPSSLAWLWDSVVYQPGISGVVITTVEDSMIPNGTENVNVLVRKYVADRQAQGKNVCLGDLPSSFAGLTTDRYHLTAGGKDAVASALVAPTLKAIARTCAADLTASLPVVTLAATIANAAEPSTNGQFTVSRTGSTATPLTVYFSVSGTATAGTDYSNIGTNVLIPAGSATASIPVTVIDDSIYEGNETVVLTLNPNASYTVGGSSSATVTISDNDAPSGPTVSVTPSTPAQGDMVTVTWSGISSPAPRDWLGLYAAGSGNTSYLLWFYVSCSKGAVAGKASGACNAQIPGGLANGNYNFRLLSNDSYNLITSSNPVVVGRPVVSVAATANAAEPSTPGQFTFTRTGTTTNPLTVPFTVGGGATPGTDYASIGTSVVIPAGSAAATIAVSVIDDSVYEGTETVVVTLTPNSAYGLGLATATVSILDDDKPMVTIIATDAAAAEAGLDAGTFRVSRDGVTTAPLTVNYAVGGTATNGVDYQLLTGALTIPAGQASANITVAPINDSLFEGPETVIVTLNSSANYIVGTPSTASVTISDDDKPVVTVVVTDAAAAETGLDPGVFTVTRNGITTAPLMVNYSISGSATNGVDYQLLSGTLTIPAGNASGNIVVTPIDDSTPEANETVVLTLTAGSGYLVGVPNSATMTIVDNDGQRKKHVSAP